MNLTGKRIVITRPRAQAEEFANALIAEGAQPIFFPVIEIAPLSNYVALDSALLKLEQYEWVIFTSIHGVDAFFKRLEFLTIKQIPAGLRVAAIGAKTASCLSEYGVAADFVPNEYMAEAILPGLGQDISGRHFLLPKSELAREFLAEEIRSTGGIVDEVVAYHTRTTHPDSSAVETLRSGVEVVTFASPSSVKTFLALLVGYGLDMTDFPGNPLIACIGPVTASAVREAGLPVHVEAKEHTISGLINALKEM